jgi:hypothetical protein
MRKKIDALVLFLLLGLSVGVLATTWAAKEMECALCGRSTQMEVIASYGSYLYRWPSKYQLIFWPATTGRALYFCKHCHLAMFMGDFQDLAKLPEEKRAAVKKAIAPLKQKQADKRYYEIPMSYRLKIAEAAYRQLDKDDAFWCRFYRIQGYHLAAEGDQKGARAARLKALQLAEKMIKEKVAEPPMKELVFIKGSMLHFAGQKDKAIAALKLVKQTPIKPSKTMSAEHAKNATEYIDSLAADFLKMIEKGEKVPGQ